MPLLLPAAAVLLTGELPPLTRVFLALLAAHAGQDTSADCPMPLRMSDTAAAHNGCTAFSVAQVCHHQLVERLHLVHWD